MCVGVAHTKAGRKGYQWQDVTVSAFDDDIEEGVDWFNWNGIFRAVYLETTRSAFIQDYTIKTRMDGSVSVEVVLDSDATLRRVPSMRRL